MINNWDFLSFEGETEQMEAMAESLAVSVQFAIQKSMSKSGVSQKELASRIGVSPARVSQILASHGRNLTLKTLGKIAHALGEDFEFISTRELQKLRLSPTSPSTSEQDSVNLPLTRHIKSWNLRGANQNRDIAELAAA